MTEGTIDLTQFPEYLLRQVAGLATRDIAAIQIYFETCSEETKERFVYNGFIDFDDNGRAVITNRTREFLSAALEWKREPKSLYDALIAHIEQRRRDPEFMQMLSDSIARSQEVLKLLEWE